MNLPQGLTINVRWREGAYGGECEASCINDGKQYVGTYVLSRHTLTYFEGSPIEPIAYAEERAISNLIRTLRS